MWILFPLLLLSPGLALRTFEPPVPTRLSRSEPVEGWLDVRLNQFMAANNETFPMRYYYNKLNETDENIVIFVGAEWEISPDWAAGGLGYDIATMLNASLFYTEHRYYGQTRPTRETSVQELRYLTIDQSLADLAQFIQHVKSDHFENGQYKAAKVVLVGCSLAGSMATWMRLAYPHVVDVAVSDSGPLHAQEDFPEYLEVVSNELARQGGEQCRTSVDQAVAALLAAATTQAGLIQISEMFNTCTTLSGTSQLDLSTFFWFGITETFAWLVQAAAPGDVTRACAILTNPAVASPMQRLANYFNGARGEECLETRYSQVVVAHSNTSYDDPHSEFRLWTYQTCVEFGWYQTTTGSDHPFESTVPLEFFHQMCKDFFSDQFDEEFLRAGITRTNQFFAGLTHMPDYVISVQGTGDPWSPMGPDPRHATVKSPVFMMEGASHCNAIASFDESNPEVIREAQEQILEYVNYFVAGVPFNGSSRALSSLAFLIAALLTAVMVV